MICYHVLIKMEGLVGCFRQWQTGGFCLEKTLQFVCSSILSIVATIQLVLLLKADCFVLTWMKLKHLLYTLIILSLITNCIHCLLYQHVYWFDIETMMFNLYFLTTVFFFAHQLFSSMYPNRKRPQIGLKVGYATFVLFYFALLFIAVFVPDPACEQIWFITVRVIGVILAVVFVIVGYIHEDRQKKRFENYIRHSFSNPLPQLRVWILINLIAQAANLTESIIFASRPQIHCKFDPQNEQINYVIDFAMVIITFYFPLGSTLYTFWQPILPVKKKLPERISTRSREDTVEMCHPGLEIVNRSSSSSQ